MEDNNTNREVKEMSFGDAANNTAAAPVSTPKQPEENNTAGGGNNSFYDRQQDNGPKEAWYKDWRGKTLGITLAALILIGGGIPAGMAIGGYWKEYSFDGLVDKTEVETIYDIAENEVERIYNIALREHYDNMVYEGYFTKSAHDKKIKDSEEAADDSIDNKKEELKSNYGNTWEEEYDNFLKESGFHTSANGGEEEWKADMIAADIESDVKSQYTSKGSITSVAREIDVKADEIKYKSTDSNAKGKYYYIENLVPTFYTQNAQTSGKDAWDTNVLDEEGNPVSYSYTPEDLVGMYLLTYQPIVFNNSLLPFIPVEGANDTTADLQGDNIYMTNEDIQKAWSFAKVDAAGTGEVAADNYGGIQQKYKVDFTGQGLGQEANIAVNYDMAKNNIATSTWTITELVNAGFSNVGTGMSVSTATTTLINDMNTQEVQSFSEGISEALKGVNLLTDDAATKRTIAYEGIYGDTVTFISTNGLNNIGVSFEGEEIVIEQLDNYIGKKDALDLGFISSFNSWFETAFKHITILDYLFDWRDATAIVEEGKFDEVGSVVDQDDIDAIGDTAGVSVQEIIQDAFKFTLLKDVAISEKTNIATAYTSAESFYKTNWEDYDISEFNDSVSSDLITFKGGSNLNVISNSFFDNLPTGTGSAKEKNEVILNKGGNQ